MGPFAFPAKVEDQAVRKRAMALLREKGVRLPTFAELAEPNRAPGRHPRRPRPRSAPTIRIRTISIACTGSTTPARTGQAAVPVHIELPEALTGVKARIVVAIGALFPMIRAHKVLAAYACLAPRLVAGRFDPTRQRAVWPSTGNYCRGGVAISRILGCRGVAVLPAGMSRSASTGSAQWVTRARGHRAHARHRVQRQGDLRQVRRAGARSGQRDRQPVQRVRQLPRRTGAAPARRSRRSSSRCGKTPQGLRLAGFVSASGSAGTLAAGDYLKAQHGTQDRRRRGGRVPDAAQQRLRRAQHPGHRRQARAADPQRHEHRPRDRRLATRRPTASTPCSTPTSGRAYLAAPARRAPDARARARRLRPLRRSPTSLGAIKMAKHLRARPRRRHRHGRHRRPRDVRAASSRATCERRHNRGEHDRASWPPSWSAGTCSAPTPSTCSRPPSASASASSISATSPGSSSRASRSPTSSGASRRTSGAACTTLVPQWDEMITAFNRDSGMAGRRMSRCRAGDERA